MIVIVNYRNSFVAPKLNESTFVANLHRNSLEVFDLFLLVSIQPWKGWMHDLLCRHVKQLQTHVKFCLGSYKS